MIAGVPYDAEIAYLESTGTQWIDTGIVPNDSIRFEIDWASIVNNVSGGGRICGARINAGNGYSVGTSTGSAGFQLNSTWYFDFGKRINATTGFQTSVTVDTLRHLFAVRPDGGYLDGSRIIAFAGYSQSPVTDTFSIFGYRNAQTGDTPHGCGRCWGFKMWYNSILVRDLIPVRVGSGANAVGYMYDRVTRKLFGNKGSGAFVLGPDVATPVMGLRRYPQSRLGKMGARHMIYGGN